MTRPPLELHAIVTTATGANHRWDANQAPGSRPRNLSFRTKIGEGFSDATVQLARRIDFDYPDLELVNNVTFAGADGSIAYEGRLSAMPRELGDSHSIGVQLAGWMSHAKDRKFQEIYVDRDLSQWGPIPRTRKVTLLSGNVSPNDGSVVPDAAGGSAVDTSFTGAWTTPFQPYSEAWYDAGPGLLVGKVAYTWTRGANFGTAAPFTIQIVAAPDQVPTGPSVSGNLVGTGPSTSTFTPTTPTRYMYLQALYAATAAGAQGAVYNVLWSKLAVYGTHGLNLRTGEVGEPDGVVASDVIRDITRRFCPLLNTAGVQDTGYVIQHLAFKDRTFPYDAFLEVNKYHLWHLGVWENRTLVFAPYDLTDYDWEIRTDDPGTTFSPQGPSTEDLFNGIVVTYTDVLTGIQNVIGPDTNADLRDPSTSNPWNKAGLDHWDEITLSSPTIAAQAVFIGRAALAQRNAPKAPGTITVRGWVRDRAGTYQPAWRVRAGDTVAVTNFPNDTPRLIHETSYDAESQTVTISVDAPASALDAVLDRVSAGLSARGLT